MLGFTLLDWLALAIIVYSVVMSAIKGFVREVLGLTSVVVGILLASWFYRPASPLFKDVVKTENIALFCAFTAIFLGTLLVGFVVIWLVARFMKFAGVQWFDRVLGAGFGFIRGWMLGSIIFLGLTSFDIQTDRVKSSVLAPYLLPGARVIAVVTPYDMKARFLTGYRAIEHWWRQHS
jgi:membrane protein required for colicin V production